MLTTQWIYKESKKTRQKCGFVWWREISCENNIIDAVVVAVAAAVVVGKTIGNFSTTTKFYQISTKNHRD